ncbi:uncharacterized protein DFL_007220 [Arthrobotrys flagrans]|uniref:Uncharacterized protein n=1 Tax=Arthrobotrys flagrans TaxID=97331 RepID=A0A436ZV51_ARTFL|nr:hypothetical protein DFL_007220 [Arthrobotrys flagrans]
MTSPLVNVFVAPGLYINPQDIAIGPLGYEQCGGSDRWCFFAPANLTGTCGTWLGLSDHCCWATTRENDVEGYKLCEGIAGIRDTPFDRFGSSDAFNAAGSTCPSGNFAFFEYDDESGGITAACCPNGQTSQAFLITTNNDYTQYFVDGIRCGTFEVPGELQNPTTEPIPTSTSGNGDSTASRSQPTPSPPTTATPTGTGTASATGGQATTTSGSAANRAPKMSYLIVGSLIFGLFFGGSL